MADPRAALEALLDSCDGCGCLGEPHAHRAEQALRRVLDVHQPIWFDRWFREEADATRVTQWQCPVCQESGEGPGYCRTATTIADVLEGKA